MTRWIVVADSAGARLFETGVKGRKPWKLVEELRHPESRAKGSDLLTDRQGAPEERGEHPKDHEVEKFALQLASTLELAANQQRYDALVLAGPPKFLGLLRAKLGKPTLERVTEEFAKDFAHLKEHQLQERLGM